MPTLALVWKQRGATAYATPASSAPAGWSQVCPVLWVDRGALPKVEVVCAALSPDETGVEAKYFAEVVRRCGARLAMADAPLRAPIADGQGLLRKQGYQTTDFEVVATRFGDRVARTRRLWWSWLPVGRPADSNGTAALDRGRRALAECEQPVAETWESCFLPIGAIPDGAWSHDEATLDERIGTTGDPMLPKPAGRFKPVAGEEGLMFYRMKGPGPTPRRSNNGVKGPYVLDAREGARVHARFCRRSCGGRRAALRLSGALLCKRGCRRRTCWTQQRSGAS